ncbi:hypothetical protein RMB_05715 [Rickettsia massiliae str. AZT80]|uniref:Uncharacterized protein n=1 Tax=Rickettsia massiliae str. AZT80 TaxID=1105112 RepID=H6QJP0_RICMA|nr:hypothetical protein RMB_05715 [Rickettsia massiliae str. AZT80]
MAETKRLLPVVPFTIKPVILLIIKCVPCANFLEKVEAALYVLKNNTQVETIIIYRALFIKNRYRHLPFCNY